MTEKINTILFFGGFILMMVGLCNQMRINDDKQTELLKKFNIEYDKLLKNFDIIKKNNLSKYYD